MRNFSYWTSIFSMTSWRNDRDEKEKNIPLHICVSLSGQTVSNVYWVSDVSDTSSDILGSAADFQLWLDVCPPDITFRISWRITCDTEAMCYFLPLISNIPSRCKTTFLHITMRLRNRSSCFQTFRFWTYEHSFRNSTSTCTIWMDVFVMRFFDILHMIRGMNTYSPILFFIWKERRGISVSNMKACPMLQRKCNTY